MKKITIINARFIKPLDQDLLDELSKINPDIIITTWNKIIDKEVILGLQKKGHVIDIQMGSERMSMGGGQIISRDSDTGILFGGSEPRKDGSAVGW